MRRWVDFAAGLRRSRAPPVAPGAHPEPLPHERYLWDSGFHFGEWLEPGRQDGGGLPRALRGRPRPGGDGLPAPLGGRAGPHRRACSATRGRPRALRRARRQRARRLAHEFIDARTATSGPATQANLVRALAFGLVPDELRPRVADLVALIRGRRHPPRAPGFLATPFLLPVLADHGHLDVAYELLFQDTEPSWLAMIDRGATTIWEEWEGVRPDGTRRSSLNHYSKGAVISLPAPLRRRASDRRARIPALPRRAPTGRGDHPRAHAPRLAARADRSGVAARRRRRQIDVTVPPGTEAELDLPDGAHEQVAAGRHHRRWTT